MKMTERQKELYKRGQRCAEEYNDINTAYRFMDFEALEDTMSSKYVRFFEAGFYGEAPEYVEAIRYGEVPENGFSKNHADNSFEKGVSCVKIIRKESDRDYKSIYDITLGGQGIEKITVSGWYFGDCGSDGEPLLIGAKRI